MNLQFGPINKEKSKWDDDGFGSDLGELWIRDLEESCLLIGFISIARLDGIKNKVKQPTTMDDYLQMDDYETEPPVQSGKKRVRRSDYSLQFRRFLCVFD